MPESGASRAGGVRYRTVDVGSKLGRLELLELLGEGGMATVFRAHDSSLRRDVAVKVLFPHLARKPEVVSRFHREARAAAALDHPNILRVIDVGGGPGEASDDGSCDPPYMVLELIDGGTLRDLSDGGEPLLAESVAAIGAVLCRALGTAHEAGIIHRDIKPANIMATVAGDGSARIVVADFGVAHVSHEDSVVTRTGALLGTPAYMSPEQAAADPLDARSDLYSLGATLYRLVTGSMPFSGSTPKVVVAIMGGNFTPVLRRNAAAGPDLARVIERLMSTDPEDRYPDAVAAEEALLAVLELAGIDLETAISDALGDGDELRATVLGATLARAEAAAAEGRVPTAIALTDRALALEAKNERALALLDSLATHGRARWKWWLLGAATIAAGAVGLATANVIPGIGGSGSEPVAIAERLDAGPTVVADAAALALEPIDTAPLSAPEPADAGRKRDRDRDTKVATDRVAPTAAIDAGLTRKPDAAARVVIAPPDLPPAPPEYGTLEVRSPVPCTLRVDGKNPTEFNKKKTMKLPLGPHRVTCKNAAGRTESRTVTVTKERAAKANFAFKVKVFVKIGDGVEVGGRLVKSGSSFTTSPKRMKITVVRGKERATAFVSIVKDCTLTGSPLRCVPKK